MFCIMFQMPNQSNQLNQPCQLDQIDHPIIVCTPAGRQRYLEILARYILTNPNISEWHLWANTDNRSDLNYLDDLERRFGSSGSSNQTPKIRIIRPSWPFEGAFSIHRYFPVSMNPDAIYVRLDDDIIWIADSAIERLAYRRLKDPHPFLMYGNVINSGLTSHLHQRAGRLTKVHGIAGYLCMDEVGWGKWEFARDAHLAFLDKPNTEHWTLTDWDLYFYERHSINTISWLGSDVPRWAGMMDRDEEWWLSVEAPTRSQRPCKIVGDAVFVHFAFYSQRKKLEAECPWLLGKYAEIAPKL